MLTESNVWDHFDALAERWSHPDARSFFEAALTRSAYNLERGTPGAPHHESLEWLGDRILAAIVAKRLWARFPYAAPGRFDLARDELTSAAPLAEAGRAIGILDCIRMGDGERGQGQVERDKKVSDHVEALIGAAFVAGGWPGAEAWLDRVSLAVIPERLPEADARGTDGGGSSAMTVLNELVQQRWRMSTSKSDWLVEPEGGPDHAPRFRATLRLPNGVSYVGEIAGTKAAARASAAAAALRALRGEG
jgi:ribonuclease-3